MLVMQKTSNMLEITPDYLGGKEGIQTILNNYYEQQIKKISHSSRQLIARKLIEEGLIVEGTRVSLAEAIISSNFEIKDDLLQQLLETRLIRVENTHLGPAYEVSHDTLVEPILTSYDRRKATEIEAEREKALILERQERDAELQESRNRVKRLVIITIIGVILFIGSVIALSFAISSKNQAEKSKEIAEGEKIRAESAEKKAELLSINLANTNKVLELEQGVIKSTNQELQLALRIALESQQKVIRSKNQAVESSDQAQSRALALEALFVQKEAPSKSIRLAEAALLYDKKNALAKNIFLDNYYQYLYPFDGHLQTALFPKSIDANIDVSRIKTATYSPDAKYILLDYISNDIRFSELILLERINNNYTIKHKFKDSELIMSQTGFSQNSKKVFSVSTGFDNAANSIHIHDINNNKNTLLDKFEENLNEPIVNLDIKDIILVGVENYLYIYDANTYKKIQTITTQVPIIGNIYSYYKKNKIQNIVLVGTDGSLQTIDYENKKTNDPSSAKKKWFRSGLIAFSDNLIATTSSPFSEEKGIRLWTSKSNSLNFEQNTFLIYLKTLEPIQFITFSASSKQLIAASQKSIYIWNSDQIYEEGQESTQKTLLTAPILTIPLASKILSLSVSKEDKLLVNTEQEGLLEWHLKNSSAQLAIIPNKIVNFANFFPDNKHILGITGDETFLGNVTKQGGKAFIYNQVTQQFQNISSSKNYWDIAISPDGKFFALSDGNSIEIRKTNQAQKIISESNFANFKAAQEQKDLKIVALSWADKHIVIDTRSELTEDHTISTWNPTNLDKELSSTKLTSMSSEPYLINFSLDGQWVSYLCEAGGGTVFSVDQITPPYKASASNLEAVLLNLGLSKDNQYQWTVGVDQQIYKWDLKAQEKPALKLTNKSWQYSIGRLSKDERYLALGTATGAIQVWDIQNPQTPFFSRETNSGAITNLSFSPNNKTLLATNANGQTMLFELAIDKLKQQIKAIGVPNLLVGDRAAYNINRLN